MRCKTCAKFSSQTSQYVTNTRNSLLILILKSKTTKTGFEFDQWRVYILIKITLLKLCFQLEGEKVWGVSHREIEESGFEKKNNVFTNVLPQPFPMSNFFCFVSEPVYGDPCLGPSTSGSLQCTFHGLLLEAHWKLQLIQNMDMKLTMPCLCFSCTGC